MLYFRVHRDINTVRC